MKLADISVKRPVLTTVMMLSLVVFGIVAYPRVGVDLFPDVEFPVAVVSVVYPGADPETVESKVVEPLEEAVNQINGIDELRSTSSENYGVITLQFDLDRDADTAVQDVRDKVQTALGDLPDEVETPVIQKFDIGAAPILSLVLSGDYDTRHLTRLADETVKQRLQTLPGVGNIDIVGGQEREFHIMVDPVRLDSYGLTVNEVAQAIGSQNIDVPGGRIDQGDTEFTIKTEGEVHSAEALADLVVTSIQGRSIRVGDVAEVLDTEEEKRSHAALNGQSAVALTIQKQSGANTVAVAREVKAEVEKLREEFAGEYTISMPVDNSTFIERTIGDVQFDLVLGAILAVLIILVFLRDWRATLISALALPTSVIATVGFLNAFGFTFNQLTMLALTLSIGILIDDAIVVIENIHRHLEMGKSPWKAAREGTAEIGLAVMAITASIVAVFLPVATMKGIMGRFFFQFGVTVAVAVTVSMFVALTLTPMLSARMLKEHDHDKVGPIGRALDWFFDGMDRAYNGLIKSSLRHPFITMSVAVVSFVASLGLFGVIPTEFIPEADRGEFRVYAEMPLGTSLNKTIGEIDEITDELGEMPGVELTFATIGGGEQEQVHKGTIHVELVDAKERSFSQGDAMEYARTVLDKYKGVKLAVEPIQAVGGGGGERQGDAQFMLLGRDYDQLNATADEMIAALEEMNGFVDVDKNVRLGKPEVRVVIDRQRAADLNVPTAAIGMAIRTLYQGQDISEVATDGDRFDARVRMLESFRNDPQKLLDLQVRSSTGQLVPLSNIVHVKRGEGPATIERFNRQRQVTVLSNLEGQTVGEASGEMMALSQELAPKGVTGALGGDAERLKESMGYMLEALILAIVLIFLILAAQFESFIHPITIMLSLPLSLIGALGALALTGMNLNMFTMIGFIMLMGLVVKNAVLLVDYTNVLRREQDLELFEALVQAGTVRMRPILMTTFAMIGGMMPVALAMSAGGEGRAPMAVAIIGGLITSTLLTLVVVPVAYLLAEKLVNKIRPNHGSASEETEIGTV
jgi:HAE1 family hydrophobic/amphiphilic exporter-1